MTSTIENTLLHAMFLARHLSKCDPQYVIVVILLELGLPAHRIGYQYIKEAILLFYEEPAHLLMNGIYQAVGENIDPTAGEKQIEQAMRSVIDQAWRNRDSQVWKLYFSPDELGRIKRPSNLEFVSRIACFLELWQGCCKEVSYEQ